MATPFIEMQNVAFAYGERPILNNVNFQVAPALPVTPNQPKGKQHNDHTAQPPQR